MNRGRQPINAATVILLRPCDSEGFEVLLTRRPAGMEFLGGMYVFPGGAVKKEDCAERILRRRHGISPARARKLLGAHMSPKMALGHWVAAVRELFEKTGILLAVHETGKALDLTNNNAKARLAQKHQALLKSETDFQTLLESDQILYDASRLAYFSHWQTPEQFSTPFDTRFFLARVPETQTPLPTSTEVAHSIWLNPDHAVRLFDRGELPIIFPTFAALRTLADFDSLEKLFREYQLGTEA